MADDKRITRVEDRAPSAGEAWMPKDQRAALTAFLEKYGDGYGISVPEAGGFKYVFIARPHDAKKPALFFSVSRSAGTGRHIEKGDAIQKECCQKGVSCPEVFDTFELEIGGNKFLASCHEFIENPLHLSKCNAEEMYKLGREFGKFHGGFIAASENPYNLTQRDSGLLSIIRGKLDQVNAGSDIRHCIAECDKYLQQLRRTMDFPKGRIHGDIKANNVVWKPGNKNGKLTVEGAEPFIIDFGNSVENYPVIIEADEVMRDFSAIPERFDAACAFYSGYAENRKMAATEKEFILASVELDALRLVAVSNSKYTLAQIGEKMAGLRKTFYPEKDRTQKKAANLGVAASVALAGARRGGNG